jgi:HEPN domain-containing protein
VSRDPLAEGRRWLRQAQSDLADARALVQHGSAATACFLAQQSAEKALKAVLYALGADLAVGHSVRTLCGEVTSHIPAAVGRCGDWGSLDVYYIPTRYPDALPDGVPSEVFTTRQATDAIALAAQVLAFAGEHLG